MKKLLFLSFALGLFLPVFATIDNSKVDNSKLDQNCKLMQQELMKVLVPLEVNSKAEWVGPRGTVVNTSWAKYSYRTGGKVRFPQFCIVMKFHRKEQNRDKPDHMKLVLFVYNDESNAQWAVKGAIKCMKKFGYEDITPKGYMLDLQ